MDHTITILAQKELTKTPSSLLEGLAGSENGTFSAPKAAKHIIRSGQTYCRWQPLERGRRRMSQGDRATTRSTGTSLKCGKSLGVPRKNTELSLLELLVLLIRVMLFTLSPPSPLQLPYKRTQRASYSHGPSPHHHLLATLILVPLEIDAFCARHRFLRCRLVYTIPMAPSESLSIAKNPPGDSLTFVAHNCDSDNKRMLPLSTNLPPYFMAQTKYLVDNIRFLREIKPLGHFLPATMKFPTEKLFRHYPTSCQI